MGMAFAHNFQIIFEDISILIIFINKTK